MDSDLRPRTLANAPLPPAMARLPLNAQGYPIPWFVASLDDGSRDFRIASMERRHDAHRLRLCWVCGNPMGAYVAFVVGPMCAVNRISSEPPSHRDCAVYSARCCPFLAVPQMRRRGSHLPDDYRDPAGVAIPRNPGVALVWVTKRFSRFRAELGQPGWLWAFDQTPPTELHWYTQGRPATRDEVLATIDSGMPLLREQCQYDRRPDVSLTMLQQQYDATLSLVPAR